MNQEQQRALKKLQSLELLHRKRVLTFDENQAYRLAAAIVAPAILEVWDVVKHNPSVELHQERAQLQKEVRQLKSKLRAARAREQDLENTIRFIKYEPPTVLVEDRGEIPFEWRGSDNRRYRIVQCFVDT